MRPQGGAVVDRSFPSKVYRPRPPCMRGSQAKYTSYLFPQWSFVSLSLSNTGSSLSASYRAPWPSYQHGNFQHRPTLRHPAVQTWLRWQNFHFPLAGGGPGDLDLLNDVSLLLESSSLFWIVPRYWHKYDFKIECRSHWLLQMERVAHCGIYCIRHALCCLGPRWVWLEKMRTGWRSTRCPTNLRLVP